MEDLKHTALNTDNLFEFLWKQRIKLILLSGAVGVVALVISFFIPETFKSTFTFFPAKTSSVNISGQSRYSGTQAGEEEEAERMLQILESGEIRDKVVHEFGLLGHYEIDSTKPHYKTALYKTYASNVVAERTQFGSIEVNVFDRSPDTAALIANRIASLIDTVVNKMIKERVYYEFQIVDQEYKSSLQEIEDINTKLTQLADSGVVTSDERVALIRARSEAMNRRDSKNIKAFDDALKMNAKYGPQFDGLIAERDAKVLFLEELKVVWKQAKADSEINISHKFVVNKAEVSDKKVRPKKLMIAVIATLATFVFLILALLVNEKIKEIKAKQA